MREVILSDEPRRKLVILCGGPLHNKIVGVDRNGSVYRDATDDRVLVIYKSSGEFSGNFERFDFQGPLVGAY
jgi:hypothetical protein